MPQGKTAQSTRGLMARDVRHVPVMLDRQEIDMVRRRDIVRWLQLQSGALAR